jgi:hypothetical protein
MVKVMNPTRSHFLLTDGGTSISARSWKDQKDNDTGYNTYPFSMDKG